MVLSQLAFLAFATQLLLYGWIPQSKSQCTYAEDVHMLIIKG